MFDPEVTRVPVGGRGGSAASIELAGADGPASSTADDEATPGELASAEDTSSTAASAEPAGEGADPNAPGVASPAGALLHASAPATADRERTARTAGTRKRRFI